MTTHTPVLHGAGVRALFHRRARTLPPVTVSMPAAPARADATFGEWVNPSIRPRASQRLLVQAPN